MFRSTVLLAACLCLPSMAAAQPTSDVQQWTLVLATLRPTDTWRVHLEFQPRLGDDVSAVDQVLTRWAVGRQVTPRVSVWAGHAWAANIRPGGNVHEQRLWQQLSATFPTVQAWAPSLRLRLEQRFVPQWSDPSYRARALARVTRPLDAERRWSLALWHELFVTLDDTRVGPPQGIDRNRTFGGLRRRLSDEAQLEAGYLWQGTEPRQGPRQHAHAAFVWLDLVF